MIRVEDVAGFGWMLCEWVPPWNRPVHFLFRPATIVLALLARLPGPSLHARMVALEERRTWEGDER